MEDDEDDDKDLPLPPALLFGGSAIRVASTLLFGELSLLLLLLPLLPLVLPPLFRRRPLHANKTINIGM